MLVCCHLSLSQLYLGENYRKTSLLKSIINKVESIYIIVLVKLEAIKDLSSEFFKKHRAASLKDHFWAAAFVI